MINIQYVSDSQGNKVAVIVPIEIWEKLVSNDETTYLLQSDKMKQRLLEAKKHQTGLSMEEVCEKLGI